MHTRTIIATQNQVHDIRAHAERLQRLQRHRRRTTKYTPALFYFIHGLFFSQVQKSGEEGASSVCSKRFQVGNQIHSHTKWNEVFQGLLINDVIEMEYGERILPNDDGVH